MTYLIIMTSSVYVPGDERSRTHPGHGYPAGTEDRTTVQEFTDIENLKREVTSLVHQKKIFRVGRFEEMEYATTVEVKLKPTTRSPAYQT